MYLIKGTFLISFFFIFIHSSKSQTFGFQLDENKKKVVIPIEIISNLVVVPVILDDRIPLKFILDTGIRNTVITQKKYSDFLGFEYVKKYTITGPGGKKFVNAFVTSNVTLRIPGGVYATHHSVLTLEEDYLKLSNYLGIEIHGVFGYELFNRFVVKINYAKKQLTLMRPDLFKKKKRQQVFPMIIQDTKPYIATTFKLNDSTQFNAEFLIDTGAGYDLLLDPQSDSLIVPPKKNIRAIIGRGIGGTIIGKIGRIHSISLGKYNIPKAVANFPDSNSYADDLFYKKYIHRKGAIGGGIISRFTVTFDFFGRKMYLENLVHHKKNIHYNMSGLYIKAKGAQLKEYEIANIIPGSPGEQSGLQVGDLILALNNNATHDLSLNDINGMLNVKEGKRIVIEIERSGEYIKKVLRLIDMI